MLFRVSYFAQTRYLIQPLNEFLYGMTHSKPFKVSFFDRVFRLVRSLRFTLNFTNETRYLGTIDITTNLALFIANNVTEVSSPVHIALNIYEDTRPTVWASLHFSDCGKISNKTAALKWNMS